MTRWTYEGRTLLLDGVRQFTIMRPQPPDAASPPPVETDRTVRMLVDLLNGIETPPPIQSITRAPDPAILEGIATIVAGALMEGRAAEVLLRGGDDDRAELLALHLRLAAKRAMRSLLAAGGAT